MEAKYDPTNNCIIVTGSDDKKLSKALRNFRKEKFVLIDEDNNVLSVELLPIPNNGSEIVKVTNTFTYIK